jgi:uncharacterized membrane protein YedE/YeeE
MHDFKPLSGLVGGALIGVAAAGLWFLTGRIAGVSGILGAMLVQRAQRAWRVAFIAGLVLGGAAFSLVAPDRFAAPRGPLVVLAGAGLLVGVGTTLANGCTSGHGVCGISRLSPRSIVATLTFMITGAVAVVVLRGLGWTQ